jgi:GTPase SAR1 family protein
MSKLPNVRQFSRGSFRNGSASKDNYAEKGCREPVEIDGKYYMIDALEMPSKHLGSNTMLEQGINITEGAVLLYDICDPSTLSLVEGLEDIINGSLGKRGYGLLLVGNKSDVDDETRKVSWADGNKAAESFTLRCGFLEVSARKGDNVTDMFSKLGHEVLQMKVENQRRKEEADRESILKLNQTMARPVKKKLGLWKTLTTPFFKRW